MTTINIVRTARKVRYCATRSSSCTGSIAVGQRYRRSSLTPNDSEVGNEKWWHANECEGCAKLYDRPFPAVTP